MYDYYGQFIIKTVHRNGRSIIQCIYLGFVLRDRKILKNFTNCERPPTRVLGVGFPE